MPSPVPRWTRWVRSLVGRRIPAGLLVASDDSLPQDTDGSASTTNLSGPRRMFTCVTACLLAGPPSGPLRRRLRRLRYLHRRSDCYRLERTSCRVGVAPTEDLHLFSRHYVPVSPPVRENTVTKFQSAPGPKTGRTNPIAGHGWNPGTVLAHVGKMVALSRLGAGLLTPPGARPKVSSAPVHPIPHLSHGFNPLPARRPGESRPTATMRAVRAGGEATKTTEVDDDDRGGESSSGGTPRESTYADDVLRQLTDREEAMAARERRRSFQPGPHRSL